MPSDNFPFLFAAFAVTWIAFFGYVFFTSRRQQEMERELKVLRRLLAERGQQQERTT